MAACDEETAPAAVAKMGERWATSGPSEVWRVPGEPGVRVRTYATVRPVPAPCMMTTPQAPTLSFCGVTV
ncbi:DUF6207 family protein [Streptomyces sp. R-74717]